MTSETVARSREREQEIMSILLNSSLFEEMSPFEREQLLQYLVASYFQPRMGDNCRAHLKSA